jgi:hypothetical protein
MQRHAMLMYTSCGWFFDEVSGLETTQCLRYAARALQLAREHFDRDFEPDFVKALEQAPSNVPRLGTAKIVWEQLVVPSRVDLDRVLAHHAMSLIYRPRQRHDRVYCYELESLDEEVHGRGGNNLAVGRLHVRSRITGTEAETSFVVIHYGGLDFYTVLRKMGPTAEGEQEASPGRTDTSEGYDDFKKRLLETYRKGSFADVTALVTNEFPGQVRRIDDLFVDEQRRVIDIVLHDRFEDYHRTFERLANQDEDVLNRLGHMRQPIPRPLRAVASAYLDARLRQEISELGSGAGLARIGALFERGKAWGYQPEREPLGKVLSESLRAALTGVDQHTDLQALIARSSQLLDAGTLLGIALDPWEAQNQLLDAYAALTGHHELSPAQKQAFAALAEKLNVSPSLLGWRP